MEVLLCVFYQPKNDTVRDLKMAHCTDRISLFVTAAYQHRRMIVTLPVLVLVVVLGLNGCASAGSSLIAQAVECSSSASKLFYENQMAGLPRYVELGTNGSFSRDDIQATGRLQSVSFTSQPYIDKCRVIRAQEGYNNPDVDIFRKKNRLVVTMANESDTSKQEYRWYGGLIVNLHYLWQLDAPALGIEEVDPDGSVTRRVLYLDGRKRALTYHTGAFPEQAQPQIPATSGKVALSMI
jgi:hypothetical protein